MQPLEYPRENVKISNEGSGGGTPDEARMLQWSRSQVQLLVPRGKASGAVKQVSLYVFPFLPFLSLSM